MANKNNPGVGLTIFFGCLLNGFWVAWFWWAIHLEHNSDFGSNVAGLCFSGLGLLATSLILYRLMLTFIIWLLASPFLLIYGISYLLYSLVLYTISPYFVLCRWRRTTQFTKSSRCRLCLQCASVAEKSPLLTGGTWIFSRPVQVHETHDHPNLVKSAQTCHLCSLLYQSIAKVDDPVSKETAKSSEPFSTASSVDVKSTAVRAGTTTPLKIIVRAKRSLFKTTLELELCGNNNLRSVPIGISIRTGTL